MNSLKLESQQKLVKYVDDGTTDAIITRGFNCDFTHEAATRPSVCASCLASQRTSTGITMIYLVVIIRIIVVLIAITNNLSSGPERAISSMCVCVFVCASVSPEKIMCELNDFCHIGSL